MAAQGKPKLYARQEAKHFTNGTVSWPLVPLVPQQLRICRAELCVRPVSMDPHSFTTKRLGGFYISMPRFLAIQKME